MIDRNSPLLDQLEEAAKNASNQDREYWADLFRAARARIAAADALAAVIWEFNSGKHYTFGTVLKATDAYENSKETNQ